MSDNALDFKINGNKNMDILPGVHGSFMSRQDSLFSGGVINTVLSDYGEMLFQGIPMPYGSIWLSMYKMEHTAALSAEANASSLEAMHMLEGNIGFSPDGLLQPVNMKTGHWQMLYLPHVKNHVTLPAGSRLTTLDIHFDQQYLERLAPYFGELDMFLNKAAYGRSAILCNNSVPFSQHVKNLIGKFFEVRKSLQDQDLFLERHLMDWMAADLESSLTSMVNAEKVSAQDEKMLLEVFEYMMTNLAEPLLIPQLARMAQMNEYKFKCAFKTLFKMPVHQLLVDERLKKAMAMLHEGEFSPNDIAILSGYDSYPGFSKEFKKKFGLSPSFFLKK